MDNNTCSQPFLTLASRRDEVDRLLSFIQASFAGTLRAERLDQEAVDDLLVASEEIFANIVRHGYREDPSGEIEVAVRFEEVRVKLIFRDCAPEYDPFSPPPALPDNDLSEGGMGLVIVTELTDDRRYYRQHGQNVTILYKNYR